MSKPVAIDLSTQLGPVRDQGDVAWCGAFVAADLITNYIKNRSPVSALDVAWAALYSTEEDYLSARSKLLFSESGMTALNDYWEDYRTRMYGVPPDKRGGINVGEAVAIYNRRGGSCDETQLPSQAPVPRLDHYSYLPSQINSLSSITRSKSFPSDEPLSFGSQSKVFSWFPVKDNTAMLEALKVSRELEAKRVAQQLDLACRMRKPFETLNPASFPVDSTSLLEAEQRINFELLSGRIVSLDISGCSLLPQTPRSNLWNWYRSSCAHVVSVVGRLWRDDKKEYVYKLRNSWGSRCDIYNDYFKSRCSGGYLFVTSSDLPKLDIENLTWLE